MARERTPEQTAHAALDGWRAAERNLVRAEQGKISAALAADAAETAPQGGPIDR